MTQYFIHLKRITVCIRLMQYYIIQNFKCPSAVISASLYRYNRICTPCLTINLRYQNDPHLSVEWDVKPYYLSNSHNEMLLVSPYFNNCRDRLLS